jgi:8-oxo-dGTP diphosphatase
MVGLVTDAAGRFLLSRRRPEQHMPGAWEFPGGKRKAGESRWAALRRELAEELGIEVKAAVPLLDLVHDYADRRVRLDVWVVQGYAGLPEAREGQPLRWVALADLPNAGLLEADRPIIDALAAAHPSASL